MRMHYKNFASMDIGLIGSGTVGQAVATALADAGHTVYLGVRNQLSYKGKNALSGYPNIVVTSVEDAGAVADVVIVATPASAVPEVAYYLGEVADKVILDFSSGGMTGPVAYEHASEAISRITHCTDVAKCFNTTSYANLNQPQQQDEVVETYLAGNSKKAKAVASALCRDMGIEESFDLGGQENIPVLERLMAYWIQLDTPSFERTPLLEYVQR